MNKQFIVLMLAMLLVAPMVLAEQDSLGTYKQNDCVDLLQICGTCTYNNVTSVVLPNSTRLILDEPMTMRGAEYNYSFCNTSLLGTYSVNGVGDLDGTDNAWAYDLKITLTGAESLSDGEGSIIFVSIIIMTLFSLFFFALGMKVNSGIISLIFVFISGLLLFTTVLFTITVVSDNLSHLGNVLDGYSTFLLVIKTIISISITFLVIYALIKAYQIWGIKRGMFTDGS